MSVETGTLHNIARANEVFVCGGGHQGLSMAAHFALNGVKVSLWNRTAEISRGYSAGQGAGAAGGANHLRTKQ